MNKKHTHSYWKDVPEDLRLMCLAAFRGGENYCVEPILHLLLDRIDYCDYHVSTVTPAKILKWIDVGFEACMFPLIRHITDWYNHLDWIEVILNKAEELLSRVAPAGYKESHLEVYEDHSVFNIINFSQRLNVFFCILYMFKEDWKNYKICLEKASVDSARNIAFLLACTDINYKVFLDDWDDYLYTGTDTPEPINFLAHELPMSNIAGKIFIQTYEDYATFIKDQTEKNPSSEETENLQENVELGLQYLYHQQLTFTPPVHAEIPFSNLFDAPDEKKLEQPLDAPSKLLN